MTDAPSRVAGPDLPDSILAAEYVLRLLDPDERRVAEDRLARSRRFRALVAHWQEDFARLADTIRDVQPPGAVRDRLAEFIRAETGTAAAKRRRPLSPGRVLTGALGGLAVAAIALAVMLEVPGRLADDPVYVAEIAGEDTPFLVVARYDPRDGALVLDRQAGRGAREGRVLQLWLLPEGASAPVSLGLLPEATRTRLELPAELGSSIPDGLLEISEEPEGGSPAAGPTGPVLGLGRVQGS